MGEPVPVTTVADELEADVVCGLLRSAGLECGFRVTGEEDSAFEGLGGGRVAILVNSDDLETAQKVLGAKPGPP